jgi:hypothetical protein
MYWNNPNHKKTKQYVWLDVCNSLFVYDSVFVVYNTFLYCMTVCLVIYVNVFGGVCRCFWLGITMFDSVWQCVLVVHDMVFSCVKNVFDSVWQCVLVVYDMVFICVKNVFGSVWQCVLVVHDMVFICVKNVFGSVWQCVLVVHDMVFICVKNVFGSVWQCVLVVYDSVFW